MSDTEVTLVGGLGNSSGSSDSNVITNIGSTGTNFSGTFTGRSNYQELDNNNYDDFITSVYTDKDSKLHIIFQAGDSNLQIIRESSQSLKFQLDKSNPIGTISYDSSSGNLTITGANHEELGDVCFQGVVSGMYVKYEKED